MSTMNKKLGPIIVGMLLLSVVVFPLVGSTSVNQTSTRLNSDWWYRYHHDNQNTGFSTSTAPSICSINWTWVFDYYSPEYDCQITSPVVVEGKVLVGVTMDWCMDPIFPRDHRLVCFDAASGDILWDYVLGPWDIGYRMDAPASVAGDKVYAGCIGAFGVGRVICVNLSDGAEQWVYEIDRVIAGSPIVYDNKVYFGVSGWNMDNGKEGFYCLNAQNGSEVWKRLATPQDPIYPNKANPVFYKERIYVTTGTSDWFERVFCLDANTGATIWKYDRWDHLVNAFFRSSPVLVNELWINTLQTSGGEILYCLDANGNKDGTTDVLWETIVSQPGLYGHPISPAVDDQGNVYVGVSDSMNTYLCCYNAETGDEIWESMIEYPMSPEGAAVADGKLYFGTINDGIPYMGNYVYCVSASTGEVLWKHIVGGSIWNSPAIADGKVYVATGDGPFDAGTAEVYCFGGDNHAPDQPMTPLGPTEGHAGATYGFSTQTTDADGNDVQFGWDWDGDLIVDEWTEFYTTYPTPEVVDTMHAWDVEGTYQVRVKARDGYSPEGPWSDPLTIDILPPTTELEIGEVKGGLKLNAELNNIGDADATDITYTITCEGGFILLPKGGQTSGTIDTIPTGDSELIKIRVFGIGTTDITITAEAEGVAPVSKMVTAFVLGPFVFIR